MSPQAETAPETRPIFIIGAPRSGTSITTWVLGQHPNIQPMPETGWIASLAVGSYLSYLKGSERGRFSHLSNVDYPLARFMARIGRAVDAVVGDVFDERCLRLYGERSRQNDWRLRGKQIENPLQIRRAATDPKHRWIDGTPLNTYYVWVLSEMFPDAMFIHNLRRPDEVATSLESFDRVGAEPKELEAGLETWIEHTDNAWYAERGLGSGRVFRLDFNRIAKEPEVLFREVFEFLGEEYAPDCLLPLKEKLNSSDVAEKREKNLALLRGNNTFRRAQATYDTVVSRPASDYPDTDALAVIRQRFMDYCHDRSIV